MSICSVTMRRTTGGYTMPRTQAFCKDGVQQFLVHGREDAINYDQGTKAALNYERIVPAGGSVTSCQAEAEPSCAYRAVQ